MNLPLFTAEASIYKVRRSYSLAVNGGPRKQMLPRQFRRKRQEVLPQLRINPVLRRLCEDTAFCLNEPGNCGIPRSDLRGLRNWYIQNCGGSPDLVA